jgi:multisubunit Na+/H+ antiporter MnhG subunit
MSHVGHYRFDDLTERTTAVTLSVVVAVIVALYAVMFVALYHWSRYAPILPPDGAAETAIVQLIE